VFRRLKLLPRGLCCPVVAEGVAFKFVAGVDVTAAASAVAGAGVVDAGEEVLDAGTAAESTWSAVEFGFLLSKRLLPP
jgi:hypothetical protein